MLTKETVIDRIEILENGAIQVRRASYILEDGVRIAGPTYHRAAYVPGDTAIDAEDGRVRAHAAVAWTPDVLTAFKAKTR